MINIIILAAGKSSRLGRPKQLVNFQNQSLLKRTILQAQESGADRIFVVLGSQADKIMKETEGTKVVLVNNDEWEAGMGSSLKSGIKALNSILPETKAVIFMPCDQPFISTEVVDSLIDKYKDGNKIVASEYRSAIGIPALFDKQYFDDILTIPDDSGAKAIIDQYDVETINFDKGDIDIDTPEDLESLKNMNF